MPTWRGHEDTEALIKDMNAEIIRLERAISENDRLARFRTPDEVPLIVSPNEYVLPKKIIRPTTYTVFADDIPVRTFREEDLLVQGVLPSWENPPYMSAIALRNVSPDAVADLELPPVDTSWVTTEKLSDGGISVPMILTLWWIASIVMGIVTLLTRDNQLGLVWFMITFPLAIATTWVVLDRRYRKHLR